MAFKNNALSISKSLQEPSPSYNKHISKYFTKEACIIALLLQKRKYCIMEMTCSRLPKHASAKAGYGDSPNFLVLNQFFSLQCFCNKSWALTRKVY